MLDQIDWDSPDVQRLSQLIVAAMLDGLESELVRALAVRMVGAAISPACERQD